VRVHQAAQPVRMVLQVGIFNISSGQTLMSKDELKPSQFILVERDQSTKPNMNWRRVDSSCFCFLCLCFFVFALSFSPRSGKMVKLFVTVLGSKPITSVDIRGHDSVSELKKAIAAESPPPAPAAIDLSLYYARRDGHWLSSEDDDLMVLQDLWSLSTSSVTLVHTLKQFPRASKCVRVCDLTREVLFRLSAFSEQLAIH